MRCVGWWVGGREGDGEWILISIMTTDASHLFGCVYPHNIMYHSLYAPASQPHRHLQAVPLDVLQGYNPLAAQVRDDPFNTHTPGQKEGQPQSTD